MPDTPDGPADRLSELLAAHCHALQEWLRAGAAGRAPTPDAALAAWRAANPATDDTFERTLAQGLRFVGLVESLLRLGAAARPHETEASDWRRMIDTLHTLPFGAGADEGWQATWRSLAGQLPSSWAALLPWLQQAAASPGLTGELHRGLPLPGLAPAASRRLWLDLADAWRDYTAAEAAYRALLDEAAAAAGERLRTTVSREPPPTVRALYDRWVEASEQVWAKLIREPRYAETQARLVHAMLHCRRALQQLVAELAGHLDLPTRAEIDTLELRLRAERNRQRRLERELAALRSELALLAARVSPRP